MMNFEDLTETINRTNTNQARETLRGFLEALNPEDKVTVESLTTNAYPSIRKVSLSIQLVFPEADDEV